MIYYILLSVSLCLGVAKNIISKWGEKSFGFLNGLMSVNIMTSIVALAVFSSEITGIKSALAPLFIVMALIYGLLTLGSQSLYITCGEERLGICLFTNLCLLLCYSHGIFRY